MTESFRALCSDAYVNSKLNVKLELPRGRDTVLELFERLRKQFPEMDQFRRFREELALECPPGVAVHKWAAVRSTSIRAGVVNAQPLSESYALHLFLLEAAPYFLSIRPLDVDSLELLYGFDMECRGNHDAVIADALLSGSPLGGLLEPQGVTPVECQPAICFTHESEPGIEFQFEVKSRRSPSAPRDDEPAEPISVYFTLRRSGPVRDIKDLPQMLQDLASRGEDLIVQRIVPGLLVPLRDAIAFGRSGGD